MSKKPFDLSVMASPQFTITLPVSGREVKLRAMLTKEYKALLIAKESGQKIDAIEQVVNACLVDELDIYELPMADSEYLFVQMYMNSNGLSTIPVKYRCANEVGEGDDKKPCGATLDGVIDIEQTFVPKCEVKEMVKVNAQVTLKLVHPSIRMFDKHDGDTAAGLFALAMEAISEIYVNDTVYTKAELGDDLEQILDLMDNTAYLKIKEYLDGVQRITNYVDLKCKSCGAEEKVAVRGIDGFFV